MRGRRFLARRQWAQGLIALGRGAAAEAAEHLAEARRIFARNGHAIDTVLVTVELATALAERSRWEHVESLAKETLALLEGQPVHQDALAALRVLQDAGGRGRLDGALSRRLRQRVLRVAEQRPPGQETEAS